MNHHLFLTVPETAAKLKVSERTVIREIKRRKLPAAKVGRKHLISSEALAEYLGKKMETNNLSGKIHELCQNKKSEMITLLQKIVSIPSESETTNVTLMARYLKEKLDEFKIRNFIHGEGESIAVQGSFGYAEKGLMLDCPLDITPAGSPAKWQFSPYEGIIKGGRMIGRGTADCKAGIVAMIYTVLVLRELIDESKARIELVFDGGEQNGGYHGIRTTLREGLSIDAGIIGYASPQEGIAIGCRGYHRYTLMTRGRSVHTGHILDKGINAISHAAKLITHIEQSSLPTPSSSYFPFGSKLTFSLIEGGRAINMVPDECKMRLDIRTVPKQTRRNIQHFLTKAIKQVKKEGPTISVDCKYDNGNDGYVLDEKEEIIRSVSSAIEQVQKRKPKLIVSGEAHIGALMYQQNIPVVIWGPRGGNYHSYNEYVEIESIPETVEIYVHAILSFFEISS